MSQPETGAVEPVEASIGDLLREKHNIEPPQIEETQDEETTQETADALSEQEESETEEPAEATLDAAETEDSEQESDEPDAEQADTFETLSDFAEALEMPMDDFMASIKTTVKINGEEQEVNLNDLRAGYQMEADYRRKTTDLAEQRKAFEQERTQQTEQIQQALNQVYVMLTNDEQALQAEYNAVNWKELEELDREEYLVQESKFRKRAEALQQARQQAEGQAQQLVQERFTEHQTQLREFLQNEAELVPTVIPEWNNPEVREKEQAEMTKYLLDHGYREDEILLQTDEYGNITNPGVADHRQLAIIRDAMRYRAQDENVNLAKKKVKTLPKVVKPGNKQNKAEIQQRTKDAKKEQFMKTGSRKDLQNLILDRI